MGLVSGSGAKLQFGMESTWGTSVTPTVQIGFTSETLKFIPNYKEEDTLVGAKTTGRMDLMGRKVEGDINLIAHPDNIGWLLAAHLGAEATVGSSVTSAYTHTFTHLGVGDDNSLPHFTLLVDRIVQTFCYTSCKSNTLKLSAKPGDYLRATFSIRGYGETTSAIEVLANSGTKGLKFHHGNITVDGSSYAEITSFDLTDNNNLENDLYVMNGSAYMIEIEPQKRETTLNLEVLYSDTTEATRANKFVQGETCSVIVVFTSDSMTGGSTPYKLTITLPNCYITEAQPNVGGPDRIKLNLSLTATEQNGTEAITVELQDARSDKYVA